MTYWLDQNINSVLGWVDLGWLTYNHPLRLLNKEKWGDSKMEKLVHLDKDREIAYQLLS